MKHRRLIPFLFLATLSGLGSSCAKNEYTGRRQLMLIDEKTEMQLGVQAYQQALAESRVSNNPAEVEPLRRVGQRIAQAANKPDFKWEFNVIEDDKTMNAWCLPGGKIAFYTGIYPVLEDEAGMAFVMGHEVAHALLHHGGERISQNMVAGVGEALLGAYLGAKKPEYQQAVMAAFGVAVGVGVLLPYSRKHESEADQIGLELMAKAGYDPRASVRTWQKMASMAQGQPPEFLSTHPSHETRIHDLENQMPGALAIYQASPHASVARLPAIHDRRGGRPTSGMAVAPTRAAPAPAGYERTTMQDGRRALHLGFEFPQDVFIDTVEVNGPGGADAKVDAKIGVPGGSRRFVTLAAPQGKEFPAGRYTVIFRGTSSGRPFSATVAHDVGGADRPVRVR